MMIIVCPKCKKKYSSETFFQYHYLVAHSSQSLPCDRCLKSFPNSVTKSLHLSAHDGTLHSCNLCAKVCKSQLNLYVHLTVVHLYHGEPVCHICKVKLSRGNLVDHYARTHAGSLQRLEHSAEMICSVHSLRPFPEEHWMLIYMLKWSLQGHESGLSRNKVTAAQGSSGEETVSISNDTRFHRFPLRELDGLNSMYLDISQSSTSNLRGLGLDGRKIRDSSLDDMIEVDIRQLDIRQLNFLYEQNQMSLNEFAIRSCESNFDEHNMQSDPAPEISEASELYETTYIDGTQKLRCIACDLIYDNLDSLLADHRVIDSNINLFSD